MTKQIATTTKIQNAKVQKQSKVTAPGFYCWKVLSLLKLKVYTAN